jgi:hypothetical protein
MAEVTKVQIKAEKDLIFRRLVPFCKFLISFKTKGLFDEHDSTVSMKPLIAGNGGESTEHHGQMY